MDKKNNVYYFTLRCSPKQEVQLSPANWWYGQCQQKKRHERTVEKLAIPFTKDLHWLSWEFLSMSQNLRRHTDHPLPHLPPQTLPTPLWKIALKVGRAAWEQVSSDKSDLLQACQLRKPKKEENYSLMPRSETPPPPHPFPPTPTPRTRVRAFLKARVSTHKYQ